MDIGTAKVAAADRARVAAPRPRPGRPGRALHGGRLPAPRLRRAAGHRGPGPAGASSSAAPGSTCGVGARRAARQRPTPTRPSGPSSRRDWPTDGLAPLVAELQRHRTRPRRPHATWPTRAGSCAPWSEPASSATGCRSRRAATRRPGSGSASASRAPSTDARIEARVDRTVRGRPARRRPSASGRATAIHPRAFSAFGYFEAFDVADGAIDHATRHRRATSGAPAPTRAARRPGSASEPGIGWLDAAEPGSAATEAARWLRRLSAPAPDAAAML